MKNNVYCAHGGIGLSLPMSYEREEEGGKVRIQQINVLQRFGSHGIIFVCHLRHGNLAIMDQQLCKAPSAPLWLNNTHVHLMTEVLNLDRAAFESHREAALERVLCSVEFLWGTVRCNRSASCCTRCGRIADLAGGANEVNKSNNDESLYMWLKDAQWSTAA